MIRITTGGSPLRHGNPRAWASEEFVHTALQANNAGLVHLRLRRGPGGQLVPRRDVPAAAPRMWRAAVAFAERHPATAPAVPARLREAVVRDGSVVPAAAGEVAALSPLPGSGGAREAKVYQLQVPPAVLVARPETGTGEGAPDQCSTYDHVPTCTSTAPGQPFELGLRARSADAFTVLGRFAALTIEVLLAGGAQTVPVLAARTGLAARTVLAHLRRLHQLALVLPGQGGMWEALEEILQQAAAGSG